MKKCLNCHFGNVAYPGRPCFSTRCFSDPDRPAWKPKTNGDRIREMTNEELVKLWMTNWDDKYLLLPACASDPGIGCAHQDYVCGSCPETFRKWLETEIEEGEDGY